MRGLSRALAYLLGLALIGGLVVLSIAGVPAAAAVLLTGAAVIAMIALGGVVGGRHTPDRDPVPLNPAQGRPSGPEVAGEPANPAGPANPGEAAAGGTMEK